MTEPQSWVLIGVFATIMLGGLTLSTNMIMRSVAASVSGIEGRLDGKIEGMRAEMNARFDAMGMRIDHLDRDVTALTRRAWGEPSGE
ncbi:hypothetical protein GCM10009808_00020 [Microbacterium sediminicola]|uniref:Uncharacterized protein n=1 Tax=Microbacterium sediminicola TaxID=415210 RepID=A0ABP4TEW9_9MICO